MFDRFIVWFVNHFRAQRPFEIVENENVKTKLTPFLRKVNKINQQK